MASELNIINSALAKLGAEPLLNLNQDSPVARRAQVLYDSRRDKLLRSHPWNFAIHRQELAQVVDTPTFEFDYAYQLPNDCLRVLYVNEFQDEEWTKEGSLLLTNADEVFIRYIKQVTEAGDFDACFAEVLALDLAHELCYSITQNTSLKEVLQKEMKAVLAEARSFDGQEGYSKAPIANTWLNARY